VIVREIAAIPNVLTLSRRVADRPGLAVLESHPCGALSSSDARFSFLACDPVDVSEAWVPPAEGTARGWGGFPAAPRWIGAIPYEAGRGLERPTWCGPERRALPPMIRPRWLKYDAALRVDRDTGRVAIEADTDAAASRLARAVASVRVGPEPSRAGHCGLRIVPSQESDEAHVQRVREVLAFIARGDVYQVNLARLIELRASGRPLDVFSGLFKGAPSPYGFFLDFGDMTLCGTSPELALEVRGGSLRTAPIKGTRPRGVDAIADLSSARALEADAKERAELTMAIDLHRNDLGKIATPGSVRVRCAPRVVAGRTVWSRVAEIVARRARDTTLDDIARAMLPCGSVTGAPKVRAMEIIADLEPFRRGLYTGAYGYVGRDGGLVLAMAIRTLEIASDGTPGERRARYVTGGGIVADSDPWRELEETRWKAAQLASLLEECPQSRTKLGRIEEVGVALVD